MKNKFSIYKKRIPQYFFSVLLLIFVFANAKNTTTDFLKIKNEVNSLRPKCEWQKIEITNSKAPFLSKLVDKYLQKFCAKTGVQSPPVCLYYNSEKYENYNYYWDGKSILMGSEIVDILFQNQNFEKYFAALLAHEFAHFKLKHKPCAIFAQEEAADKLALTLIDNPEDLMFAHLFDSLTFITAQVFAEYITNTNELNTVIAQTMETFTTISPTFGKFTQCSCWMSVYHLFYVAFIKTNASTDLYIFSNELALNLVNVSSDSHSMLTMDYLKIWLPRCIEFLKHPLERDTHPSPKQLSTWSQNITTIQAA
ncbi:MAG: hypothetical protein V1646_04170 [bacterium]